MEAWLEETPDDVPLLEVLTAAVVRFNDLPPKAVPAHRQRMSLILHVPALQAHSNLRYADWRAVVARFVASRAGADENGALPQLVGHVALGAAVASYERWLADPSADLQTLITESFAQLREGFPALAPAPARAPLATGRRRR